MHYRHEFHPYFLEVDLNNRLVPIKKKYISKNVFLNLANELTKSIP